MFSVNVQHNAVMCAAVQRSPRQACHPTKLQREQSPQHQNKLSGAQTGTSRLATRSAESAQQSREAAARLSLSSSFIVTVSKQNMHVHGGM